MFKAILAKARDRTQIEADKAIISWYIEQGFSMIPIVSGKKRAAVKWEKYQKERASKEQVINWRLIDGYDLGVVCGQVSDNLVVVDFDDPKLYAKVFGKGTEQDTLVIKTSMKGRAWKRHVYFKAAHSVPTRHFEGVDIQGEGSYVKMLSSEKGYEMTTWPKEIESWEGDFTQEIMEKLTTKGEMAFEPETVCVKDLFEPAPIGTRHARLVRQVTWMRLCEVPIEEAMERTLKWNRECEDSKDDAYVEYQVHYLYHRKEVYNFKFDELPRELYSSETMDSARVILREGDPLKQTVDAMHILHAGDDRLIEFEWCSLVGSWVVKMKINTWAIGESGTGKSHLKYTLLYMVPRNLYEIFTSSSPKSFFYYVAKHGEYSLDKKLVYLDEVEASEETLPMLRHLAGQTEIVPRHLTVDDKESIDIQIKGKRAVWFTSVRVIGTDQLLNRFSNVNPDDSVEQDIAVWELQKKIHIDRDVQDETPFKLVGAMTQIIVDETADLVVRIPYGRRIVFPMIGQRRLFPIFLATIESLAKIHFLQRDRNESGEIVAKLDDFEGAKAMWLDSERAMTHRVAGKPLMVLEALPEDPELAKTRAELAEELQLSTGQIKKYSEELSERGLVNSRLRDREGGRGKGAWEYWRRKAPTMLELDVAESEAAARERVISPRCLPKSKNTLQSNNLMYDPILTNLGGKDTLNTDKASGLLKYVEDLTDEEEEESDE